MRFWRDLKGLIFDDFCRGPKKCENPKKEGEGVKNEFALVRSAELRGSAEELLESAKSSRVMQSLQLVWDALSPASRGRRIVIPLQEFRRPSILFRHRASDLHGFVKQQNKA